MKPLADVIGYRDTEFVYDPFLAPFDGKSYLLLLSDEAMAYYESHCEALSKLSVGIVSGVWDETRKEFLCPGITLEIKDVLAFDDIPVRSMLFDDEVKESTTFYVYRFTEVPKHLTAYTPHRVFNVKAYYLTLPPVAVMVDAMHDFKKKCDAQTELGKEYWKVSQEESSLEISDYVVEQITFKELVRELVHKYNII